MRILLLVHSFNSLSQRLYLELARDGHELSVEFDINDDVSCEAVRLFRPELVFAPFLKRAIPSAIWRRLPCLVVHPGPPGDRGPSALDWAILRGQEHWGVTVLQAVGELDAGPVWGSARFPMRNARKSSLYRNEVTEGAVMATRDALSRMAAGERPRPGERSRHGWQPLLRQAERAIDWQRDPSAIVLRKIHSADGFPGVEDRLFERRFRLFDAEPEGSLAGPPGQILACRDEAICRATVDGAVWIGQLQPLDPGAPSFKRPAMQALGALAEDLPRSEPGEHAAPTRREIRYEECGAVGYLHFELYNGALGTAQCRRLIAAYRQARRRATRVIVLLGGVDFWCNGMHLHCIEAADSPADASWENINAIDDLAREILDTDTQLTVAALQGNAGAGGVFLALAADRVLARSGVVLNPHYRNMGNLHGSEYWTYLLPRRLGEPRAAALMQSRLPLGAEDALALGLIDAHAGPARSAFAALVARQAVELADEAAFAQRIESKRTRRASEECIRPLADYRAAELRRMHAQFYGFDPSYHVARHRFVHRTPHGWTPLYLAHHRRTGADRA
jgi:putative two-component system hydrogenase maturation factor HypX/HoxX